MIKEALSIRWGDHAYAIEGNPFTGKEGFRFVRYRQVNAPVPAETRPKTRTERIKSIVGKTVKKAFLPALGVGAFTALAPLVPAAVESVRNGTDLLATVLELSQFIDTSTLMRSTAMGLICLSGQLSRANSTAEIRQKWPVATAGLVLLNALGLLAGQQIPANTENLPLAAQIGLKAASPFLHQDFWGHFLPNMLALSFLGAQTERRLGSKKMLGVYAASAAAGAISGNSIGASGAIMGLLGENMTDALKRKNAGKLTALAVSAALVLSSGAAGFVDQTAHLAGLVTGTVAGLISRSRLKSVNSRSESVGVGN